MYNYLKVILSAVKAYIDKIAVKMNIKVDEINNNINEIDKKVNKINNNINGINTEVNKINNNIDEINTEVNEINNKVNEIDEKIPIKISQLENDKNYATKDYVTSAKDIIILKDAVTGYEYIVKIDNGTLISFVKTSHISISKLPDKTDYTDTEEFDPTGMIVLVTLQNGFTKEITNYTYEKFVTTGSSSHIITYIECGIEYIVEVPITTRTLQEALIDFNYTTNSDGTYTITGWKETFNGVSSTEMIIPNSPLIIV